MNIAPLKGKTAFASTMRLGKRFTIHAITGVVRIKYNSNDSNIKSCPLYLGVSIRKKTAKKATVRNRVKRLLRQSARIVIREFTDAGYFEFGIPFEQVILFCNVAPTSPSNLVLYEIVNDVRAVLQAAFDYSQKHTSPQ